MKINSNYIKEYEQIIKTTNLQEGYQEVIKFFRLLKIYLQNEMKEYSFTGNVVENNMDYSYFQFTNKHLKEKGLKIVIAFVHRAFTYQVWLSGINRKVQNEYYNKLKNKPLFCELTLDPDHIDYILKSTVTNNPNYDDSQLGFDQIKTKVLEFVFNVEKIV